MKLTETHVLLTSFPFRSTGLPYPSGASSLCLYRRRPINGRPSREDPSPIPSSPVRGGSRQPRRTVSPHHFDTSIGLFGGVSVRACLPREMRERGFRRAEHRARARRFYFTPRVLDAANKSRVCKVIGRRAG